MATVTGRTGNRREKSGRTNLSAQLLFHHLVHISVSNILFKLYKTEKNRNYLMNIKVEL